MLYNNLAVEKKNQALRSSTEKLYYVWNISVKHNLRTRVDQTWNAYTVQFVSHTLAYKNAYDLAMTFMITILWLMCLPFWKQPYILQTNFANN